jgi:3-deoxy-D-manno-octulosonate 8-phosphate phosphatase (KDO 8-P phosphatase)
MLQPAHSFTPCRRIAFLPSRASLGTGGTQLAKASRKVSPAVQKRARQVRLILMDVDGVLTDGRIWLHSEADGSTTEIKGFSAYDGAGLKLAKLAGLRTGVITGRESPAVARRAREVDMDFVYQNRGEKLPAYEEILARSGLRDAEVAYIADDLPDLPLLSRVGLAVAVANAVPEVKKAAHYVTAQSGGNGAAREVVELVLKAQGKWEEAIRIARA